MVVPVVADLNVLKRQLCQNALPGLAVDKGGGVHHTPVRDDEDVLPALLCHGEVGVL